jgi:hypothetical protein
MERFMMRKKGHEMICYQYLKLEEGKPYRIRLVGKPYKFYSHFRFIKK